MTEAYSLMAESPTEFNSLLDSIVDKVMSEPNNGGGKSREFLKSKIARSVIFYGHG